MSLIELHSLPGPLSTLQAALSDAVTISVRRSYTILSIVFLYIVTFSSVILVFFKKFLLYRF